MHIFAAELGRPRKKRFMLDLLNPTTRPILVASGLWIASSLCRCKKLHSHTLPAFWFLKGCDSFIASAMSNANFRRTTVVRPNILCCKAIAWLTKTVSNWIPKTLENRPKWPGLATRSFRCLLVVLCGTLYAFSAAFFGEFLHSHIRHCSF